MSFLFTLGVLTVAVVGAIGVFCAVMAVLDRTLWRVP